MVLIVILYALFASTFSMGKVLLNYAQPIFLVGVRMIIAGFLLLSYQYIKNRTSFKFEKRHLALYLQAMLFTNYIPYILRFWGLQHMTSSKACLLQNLSPFISYILAYLISSEKVTLKKVTGLLIGFIGFLPLIAPAPSANLMLNGFIAVPDLYMILSVSALCYGWIVLRTLIVDHHYTPPMINGISMFGSGILALATSFIVEPASEITDIVSFTAILSFIIIVSNLLCHNLYASLLRTYSPTFLSFASFLAPLFAAFYGWIFFHETISWQFITAACFVFVGLTLFHQDELQEREREMVVSET